MTAFAESIVVVGAGTMGSGIAQVIAQSGRAVTLVDASQAQLDRAERGIRANLERAVERGRLSRDAADAALRQIRRETTLDSISATAFAVEAVYEREDVKRDVLAALDGKVNEQGIIASNTSSISITRLSTATRRPDRVVGMHFFNPVPVMQLVEVVRGQRTADVVVERTVQLAAELGKTPVVVNDFPGFVSNRILMPLINEAVYALMEGVGDRDGIDTIMKLGMNHPMGPLQLADLIGLDVCLHVMETLHAGLGDPKYRPCPLLRRMVDAGLLGRKSGAGFYQYG